MKSYDHRKIEKKWQKEWEKSGIYRSTEDPKRHKSYVLDMFPYPSGEGLHVGHPKGYIATDIFSRHKRMQGFSVLHPMGWDAFGLPAENFAIKNKVHPRVAVEKNITRFKEQLSMIGLDYDWDREINTTDPKYYKWTQWIFLKLYEKGLAYQSYEPINWCPTCQTGLSNEDLDGNQCERCGTIVEKRPMRQWILKITEYADRMLEDLKLLPEWQEHIKESQRNWIGKSEGAEIDFALDLGKKYKFVILHGFQSAPDRPRWIWAKQKLEEMGHEVILPALPNPDHPTENEWVSAALAATTYDEQTVLVGHSLGAVAALKVLEKLDTPIARLVTVGGFISKNFKDNPRPFEGTFTWKFDGTKIRSNVHSITILHDPLDYAVSDVQAKELSDLLHTPITIGSSNKPHFTGDTEPDVVMWLRSTIRVFTTRPDTLFGATFLILAPEHPWVTLALQHKTVLKNNAEVTKYVEKAKQKTELERMTDQKEKTGLELKGVKAINPATGEQIPLYVADYVLAQYGTGAIMAVPAHDERDFEFAKKFDLPTREVVGRTIRNISGGDAVRLDTPWKDRDAVMALIKHWEKDEYLCISWKEHSMRSFPSGGIEKGEQPAEAAVREVREETGYKNIEIDKQLGGFTYIEFYHQIKKTNIRARFRYFIGKLRDGEKDTVDEHEAAMHEVVWVPKKELSSFLMIKEKDRILRLMEDDREMAYSGDGYMVNSGELDGLSVGEAKQKATEKFGRKKVTYKIRDWVFSRQRYWGEPIPMIHCEKCGVVPVPEKDLPVKLPEVKHYEPTGTGESPLANISEWVNVACSKCAGEGKRETNTMPQWAGSSWYYLRYMDPHNNEMLVDPKKEKYWAPVDLYVGGAEHATRHLIYARFWHKFLYDIGVVTTPEPFTRLISVGLIQAEDGRKMSKRYGNVINPDDIVETYGADTLRVYEMFMGPFTDSIAWSPQSMIGSRRFLERLWRAQEYITESSQLSDTKYLAIERQLHKTIKKVGEDIEAFKFNTAISQMMIFLNAVEKEKQIGREQWSSFLKIIAPFAPHMAEELWHELGSDTSIHVEKWPRYEEELLHDLEIVIALQIDGKTRGEMRVAVEADKDALEGTAREELKDRLEGKKVARVVVVPGRLVNFVLEK